MIYLVVFIIYILLILDSIFMFGHKEPKWKIKKKRKLRFSKELK